MKTENFIRVVALLVGLPLISLIVYRNYWSIEGIDGRYEPNHCWAMPMYKREPASFSQFNHKWSLDEVYIPSDDISIPLIAHQQVYFYGSTNPCENMSLSVLNSTHGDALQNDLVNTPSIVGVDLFYDGGQIYIGYHGYGKPIATSTEAAGGIIAYDTDNDAVAWSKIISGTLKIVSVAVGNETLAFSGDRAGKTYLLDTSNGNIITTQQYERYETPGAGIVFWYTHITDKTDKDFWLAKLGDVHQPPILLEDQDLLIRTREGNQIGAIQRIDSETGNVVWEIENVLSNVAQLDNFAFYITSGAELNAVHVESGEIYSSLSIPPFHIEMGTDRGFYVATGESNRVYAYFGDSRQLFAFDFTPPQE